jgi:hypothetical protein
MRLQVGLIGKPINRRLFYGRIVQFGRKAQTVTVARRGVFAKTIPLGGRMNKYKAVALKNRISGTYRMRVRAMAARPFVFSPRTELRAAINKRIRDFWEGALRRAAQGASDD